MCESNMKLNDLPFNWFDVLLLIWLVIGVFRGRKRGMSAEFMTFLQWVAIVIVGGVAYVPVGRWFAQTSQVFGMLFCYVTAYLVLAILVALAFVILKRYFGGKLVGSDAFGKSEYYLGMPAGMVRFASMMIFALALLNARLYSQHEIQAYKKFQMENFDSEFFPGLQSLQSNVFEKSFSGRYIREYLGFLLIKPTPPSGGKPFKQKDWKGP